jgi:hypothetical protein
MRFTPIFSGPSVNTSTDRHKRIILFSLLAGLLFCTAVNATTFGDVSNVWIFNDTVATGATTPAWTVVPRVYDYRRQANYSTGDVAATKRFIIVNNSAASMGNQSFINALYENERVALIGNITGVYEPLSYFTYGIFWNAKLYNFTLELWYRFSHGENDSISQLQNRAIWSYSDGAYGLELYRYYFNQNVRYCVWYEPVDTVKSFTLCTPPYNSPLMNSSWIHLSLVMNAGGDANGSALGKAGYLMLLVNGTGNSTSTYGDFEHPLTPTNYTDPGSPLFFGYSNHLGAHSALAYFDEIRLWNMSRTMANISALKSISLPYEEPVSEDIANLTVTVYDEDTDVPITNLSMYAWLFNSNLSRNISIFNQTAVANLTNLHLGDFSMRVAQYNESDYATRTRFFTFNSSNYTPSIRFYLVNISHATSTPVLIQVKDENGLGLSNYTVQALKRFTDHGYLPVEDALTDRSGQTHMFFHLNTIPYKFSIFRNGTLVGTTDPITITAPGPINLVIYLGTDPLRALRRADNLTIAFSSLTAVNRTGNLTMLWYDPYADVISANFTISYVSSLGKFVDVCSRSATGSSGTLNCTSLPNISGRTYIVQGCVSLNATASKECKTTQFIMWMPDDAGDAGLFFVVLLILAFAGALIYSIAGFLFGLMGGVMLAALLGLITWGWGVVALLLFLLGFRFYMLRS